MISWLLYTLIVSACVLTAAYAADWLARVARRPVRFLWIASATLIVLLPALAPLRAGRGAQGAATRVDISSLDLLQTSVASVGRRVPETARWYALAAWILASLAVAASFAIAYLRLRRARRRWPVIDLHGHRVRVAPGEGPIVVGLVRPEIILPRWVLNRADEEQRVIIAHESAHVSASDPVLLALACTAVALMPWNPALWVILSRLRLAIELDCDARVLRGGVSPRSYGSLLVDVAESALPLRFAATALADDSSHLQQRILAMQPRPLTHRFLRGGSAALIAFAGLLAACEAKMPTSKDIEALDARGVEQGARSLGVVADSLTAWSVDGVATTAAKARSIPSDSIVTVNVVKMPKGARVLIVTKQGQQTIHVAGNPNAHPILFIDGVRKDESALKSLDRSRIESVNVLKGSAAVEQYGADATNGVIVVTTKAASR
jgi:TonB-dependent SusC/RagA subfamily outer membrane receptor